MSCTACEIHPEGAFASAGEDLEFEKTLTGHPVLMTIPGPVDWPKHGLVERFFPMLPMRRKMVLRPIGLPLPGMLVEARARIGSLTSGI